MQVILSIYMQVEGDIYLNEELPLLFNQVFLMKKA